ncbi:hypothetical protein BN1088_1432851 [Sphingobacterium sp. PM2-P1-29]|nr:hypothetical protein BN1088_1432851 [Sphingobacterium sp. PM2-P1-29]
MPFISGNASKKNLESSLPNTKNQRSIAKKLKIRKSVSDVLKTYILTEKHMLIDGFIYGQTAQNGLSLTL